MFCSKCGQKLEVDYHFCPKCGAKAVQKQPEKQLLFQAEEMNWGQIPRNSGEWLKTQWQVFQDGTVIEESEYDEMFDFFSGLVKEARIYRNQYRMDTEQFEQLLTIVQREFPRCSTYFGCCDGVGWKMKSYGSDGAEIHCISGFIYGNATLEAIEKLLKSAESKGNRF